MARPRLGGGQPVPRESLLRAWALVLSAASATAGQQHARQQHARPGDTWRGRPFHSTAAARVGIFW